MNKIASRSIWTVAVGTALLCGFASGVAFDRAPTDHAPSSAFTTVEPPSATTSAPAPSPVKVVAPSPAPVTVEDGTWTVGTDIPAGTYRVTANVESGCYWAILKSGTNGEDIIANDIVDGGRPQVTLKKGQDFKTSDCGQWNKIK